MLLFVLGACAVALTCAAISLMTTKKRLVDHEIDQLIARKLSTQRDSMAVQVLDLTEANGVMRNLLIDIAENEVTAELRPDMPADVMTRIVADRTARRQELLAEVDAVLRSCRMADAEM